MEYIYICAYHHTTFHAPNSNCSLVATVKLQTKEIFLVAPVLLFCILQIYVSYFC